jgi:NADH:ubiquinone oxidoreductase subunit H
MINLNSTPFSLLFSFLDVILVLLPVLIAVAFVTVAERKTLASMQRRLGPNIVGIYGSLQAFADALKLILKEYIAPTQANLILFFLGPAERYGKSLLWDKLSNSGNFLKLMIPSHN